MWKRGKRSRSKSCTLQPCCARRVETVLPAGPPPMTTTSAVPLPWDEAMRGSFFRTPRDAVGTVSAPAAGGAFVRQPGGPEQGGQLAQLRLGQVAELPQVAVADKAAQLFQQGQPRHGDADVDDAAVVGGAVAVDEAAALQL